MPIIHLGSVQGERPMPGRVHYGAAKSGLIGLTKVMAVELAEYGICVHTIEPGATESEMTRPYLEIPGERRKMLDAIPLHRIGTPDDIAGLAVFLASSESDYIAQGVALLVSGLAGDIRYYTGRAEPFGLVAPSRIHGLAH